MSKGTELYKKAKKIIPGGTELLSKRPEMHLPEIWPSYYSKAKGCEVWDLDGNKYYDVCYMGIGANVLGYAYDPVDDAAKEAIDSGSMCTLNPPEEIELADLLCDMHPWADKVRYAKAGGEGLTVAVRIARAYKKKSRILVCGYHGWHDWYIAANLGDDDQLSGVHLAGLDPGGVPKGLAGSVYTFMYNDYEGFEKLMDKYQGEIAAVVMEPIRNDYPEDGFLEKIRARTEADGSVLIFDEVSSGFRICAGGSHLALGVNPDIAVFAKAMTNGYPLSAIIGRGEIMDAAEESFISSTFWTERIGYMATLKSIREYLRLKVDEHQMRIGEKVQKGWIKAAEEVGLDLEVGGIYPISHFGFEMDNPLIGKTFFTQEMLKRGYLASTAFYTSLAHTDEIVEQYLKDCKEVFAMVKEVFDKGEDLADSLDGPVCHSGFERLN